MLSSLVKKHETKRIESRNNQEHLKRKTLKSLYVFNKAALEVVNVGVASVYSNQVQIDQEMKFMQNHIETLSQLTNQWSTMMDKFYDSLKELGDVENWAQSIERDLITVTSCLEHVHK